MNSTVFCPKNKLLIILVLIIALIPTALAIHFKLNMNIEEIAPHRVITMSIGTPQGLSYSVTDEKDINLFSDIISGSKLIDENFRDLSADTPFTLSISENDGLTKNYKFFMANNSDGCIFTDSDGKYFLISEKNAVKLLARNEFSSVNTFAVVPNAQILRNGNLVTIEPAGGTWSYIEADGNFSEKSVTPSQNPVPTTLISASAVGIGELSFSGNTAPDNASVVLTQDGAVKHTGSYDTLLNSNVMSPYDTYYDMVITAEWLKSEDRDFYGTVTYNVRVLYDVAPTYEIVYNGIVSKGDFTIIKMWSFNEGEKLYLQSAYPFPKELKVFKSPNGYSYAFLPAEFSSSSTGRYDLILSTADGSSQTFPITVNAGRTPATTSQDMLISDANLQTSFTAEAIEQFKQTVAAKTETTSPTALWEGKFVYPDKENKGIAGAGMANYGTYRTVRGIHQEAYVHTGMDIAMAEGAEVYASNNGKVVFAGNLTLTGNTVIIDHGCSILTYYGHLSSISVAEGDNVQKLSVIGTAGSTGFAAKHDGAGCVPASQVHFAASVEGVFINPYYLWKVGVDFDD